MNQLGKFTKIANAPRQTDYEIRQGIFNSLQNEIEDLRAYRKTIKDPSKKELVNRTILQINKEQFKIGGYEFYKEGDTKIGANDNENQNHKRY